MPLQAHALQEYASDPIECRDVGDWVTIDDDEICPLPWGDFTEIGAVAREKMRVLVCRRSQRLGRRQTCLDELADLDMEPGTRKISRITGVAPGEDRDAGAPQLRNVRPSCLVRRGHLVNEPLERGSVVRSWAGEEGCEHLRCRDISLA